MHFYSLLHLDNTQNSAMNVRVDSFEKQVVLYINNAITLKKSLLLLGYEFTLITNNIELLRSYLNNEIMHLNVVEVKMQNYFPEGIQFYSAHYKLEVFKFIANSVKDYAIFCDLDMIAINKPTNILLNYVKKGIPLYYDITNQVIPVFTSEKIIADLTLLINYPSEGRWAGGEFISGEPIFFSKLVNIIEEILPRYLNNIHQLHHIGDEAFTSAALEIMRNQGEYISDAGSVGLVQRYWCSLTKHKQAKFSTYENVFILHLPSSKKLLSIISNYTVIISNFSIYYKIYLIYKIPFRFTQYLKIQINRLFCIIRK